MARPRGKKSKIKSLSGRGKIYGPLTREKERTAFFIKHPHSDFMGLPETGRGGL